MTFENRFYIEQLIKQYYMTNLTELKGDWKITVGKLKQQFASLTDNDLLFEEGKQDEMLGRIQAKIGKTKSEIHKLISEL